MLGIDRRIAYLVLALGTVVMIFPFYWMVGTSLKPLTEAVRFPPTVWPNTFTLENYAKVFQRIPFARYFLNSIVMSGGSVVGVLVTSTLAGYAFANMNFLGKNPLFMVVLATLMVPPELRLIPNFVIMNNLGWANTYQGLILPFAANVFSIFLMRQAFMNIPNELYDSARIDGANHPQFFAKVALPLVRPSISVVGLLAFMRSWNELFWPLVVTTGQDMRTVQVGLTVLTSDISAEAAYLMAATVLSVLPLLILYLIAQREFTEGISTTGLH